MIIHKTSNRRIHDPSSNIFSKWWKEQPWKAVVLQITVELVYIGTIILPFPSFMDKCFGLLIRKIISKISVPNLVRVFLSPSDQFCSDDMSKACSIHILRNKHIIAVKSNRESIYPLSALLWRTMQHFTTTINNCSFNSKCKIFFMCNCRNICRGTWCNCANSVAQWFAHCGTCLTPVIYFPFMLFLVYIACMRSMSAM
jgi:hypothetical protein